MNKIDMIKIGTFSLQCIFLPAMPIMLFVYVFTSVYLCICILCRNNTL
jgi:hypothetical protein